MGTTEGERIAAALGALSRTIDPARIVTGCAELVAAAAVWSGAIDHRPRMVVRCRSTAEVQQALRTARECGLPVSVRSGGHDWTGRAIRPGALVIDLREMREVSIRDGIATVAGGATADDVAAAADGEGLALATGTVGAVGIVGLTLAGGYGPLCGRLGLAADNLVAAEVVLADGQVVRAGQHGDADLLWALRGGGGNFGVVTSIEVALHPLPEVLVGSFRFSLEEADQVLAGYAELVSRAPDDLTVLLAIVPGADGTPVIVVSPTWSGAIPDGPAAMDEVAALGTPLATTVAAMSPLTRLRQLDGAFPNGPHYEIRTRNLAQLTPASAASLLEAYSARVHTTSFLNVQHFHGRATQLDVRDTAFGRREDHLMVEMIERGEPLSGWTRNTSATLAPHALPGGYPNFLGPDDQEQAQAAYGPNAARLMEIKDRFDPERVIHATPLPVHDGGR
ncbi:FAD-binding oxidoreductase [Ruania zhangjianzhongii]|uniref:FAD-binding oxidoreductase n=1 Tax=Ruania zhangjianzhongii TaxID=2603206 RepID=UPI0011C94D44|nr:FAD-dependent oxidoreductase [Ruania zhangjianzhongii]